MRGVENPSVIDFVGYNSKTERVTLAMIEERDWDGSEERLIQLQAKINNYLSFVLDGQFAQTYPEYKNKQLAFQLNCALSPDAHTRSFLDQVKHALTNYQIEWVVKILNPRDQTYQH